jgi:hypothetical protein
MSKDGMLGKRGWRIRLNLVKIYLQRARKTRNQDIQGSTKFEVLILSERSDSFAENGGSTINGALVLVAPLFKFVVVGVFALV